MATTRLSATSTSLASHVRPRLLVVDVLPHSANFEPLRTRRGELETYWKFTQKQPLDAALLPRVGGGGESGIHLDGMGSPTEVQISQSWVFHVNKALHITVRHILFDPRTEIGQCLCMVEDPAVRRSLLHRAAFPWLLWRQVEGMVQCNESQKRMQIECAESAQACRSCRTRARHTTRPLAGSAGDL